MFEWSKANEVHVPEIDEEHRTVFRLAGDFQRAVVEGGATSRVRALFEKLVAHTNSHFSHEERLMRTTLCPSYSWHKRQHDTLRGKVAQLEGRIRHGDSEAALELIEFLSRWLTDHTSLTDHIMAAHLRNYGRARTRLAS